MMHVRSYFRFQYFWVLVLAAFVATSAEATDYTVPPAFGGYSADETVNFHADVLVDTFGVPTWYANNGTALVNVTASPSGTMSIDVNGSQIALTDLDVDDLSVNDAGDGTVAVDLGVITLTLDLSYKIETVEIDLASGFSATSDGSGYFSGNAALDHTGWSTGGIIGAINYVIPSTPFSGVTSPLPMTGRLRAETYGSSLELEMIDADGITITGGGTTYVDIPDKCVFYIIWCVALVREAEIDINALTFDNFNLFLRGTSLEDPTGDPDDTDLDGVPNASDNCPDTPNPAQTNTDGSGLGDACNDANDEDGDEWEDANDNFPNCYNPDQSTAICAGDPDGDGVATAIDNCPITYNPGQSDVNGDAQGDVCQANDFDGDGWPNPEDNCQAVTNISQADRDGDGTGDACDPALILFSVDGAASSLTLDASLDAGSESQAVDASGSVSVAVSGLGGATPSLELVSGEINLGDLQTAIGVEGWALGANIDGGPVTGALQPNPGFWEVVYDIGGASELEITKTPLMAGDLFTGVGPGTVTLEFSGDMSSITDGPVRWSELDLATVFSVASVASDTQVELLGEAQGTLSGGTINWSTPLTGYHSYGWVTCTGGVCIFTEFTDGVPKFMESVKDVSPVSPMVFASSDPNALGNFTMARMEIPNDTDGDTFMHYASVSELGRTFVGSVPAGETGWDVDLTGFDLDFNAGLLTATGGFTRDLAASPIGHSLPSTASTLVETDLGGGVTELLLTVPVNVAGSFGSAGTTNSLGLNGTLVLTATLGGTAAPSDVDGDGIEDSVDNCPSTSNPLQEDTDSNGIGDACEVDPPDCCDPMPDDADGDGIENAADNCPTVWNAGQEDTDGNGIGDACNDANDADGDEWEDGNDNCQYAANPGQEDSGGVASPADPSGLIADGIGDACQCGDVNNDGKVTGIDGTLINRWAVGLPPGIAAPEKCIVIGTECNGVDATIVQRTVLGLPPGIQQLCSAAQP